MNVHSPLDAMRPRLPLGKILLGALVVPWQRRIVLGRALLLPAGALLIIATLLFATGNGRGLTYQLPFIIAQAFVYTLFAVTCHRVVLLGDDSVPRFGLASWSARETRFIGWMIAMYLVFAAVSLVPMIVLTSVLIGLTGIKPDGGASLQPFQWAILLASVPGVYVMARVSLVLPATAVDRRLNLPWSWERTAGNGWRMALVVGSFAQSRLVAQSDSVLAMAAVSLAGLPLLAIEITALSLCYHTLTPSEQ
jgi:hypothetical protein